MKDRFGAVPDSVNELINSVRLRWLGEKLGFEKISLKGDKLKAHFTTNNNVYFNSEIFGSILNYVQRHPRQCKMRDSGGKAMLLIEEIKSVDAAIEIFQQMDQRSKSANEILSK